MWPKVFAQLVDILPHVTRLLPMADKFFTSKTASEKANEAAMTALAEGVRGDLGQVTSAHAGLYRQLQDQSAQISEVAADARRAMVAIESYVDRLATLEQQHAVLANWIKSGVGLLLVLIALVVTVLVRLR